MMSSRTLGTLQGYPRTRHAPHQPPVAGGAPCGYRARGGLESHERREQPQHPEDQEAAGPEQREAYGVLAERRGRAPQAGGHPRAPPHGEPGEGEDDPGVGRQRGPQLAVGEVVDGPQPAAAGARQAGEAAEDAEPPRPVDVGVACCEGADGEQPGAGPERRRGQAGPGRRCGGGHDPARLSGPRWCRAGWWAWPGRGRPSRGPCRRSGPRPRSTMPMMASHRLCTTTARLIRKAPTSRIVTAVHAAVL